MKSLNIKKIAAVAAGAALIGTAFAGAAVTVDDGLGNFVPTLYSNGEPNVQIVLGSQAEISDAVVAANVAAAIGNKAYTTTTVSGATTTTTAGTTVTPVTLDVVRPATSVAANEYACTTGLKDNLDVAGCGVGSTALNLTAGGKSSRIANLPQMWKEISDSDWSSGLGPQRTVQVKGSSTQSSTERQYLECFGQTQYSDSMDSYVSEGMECFWRATFASPLPVCADTSKTYAACDSTDKIDSTSEPTTIYFLGDPWVVTGVAMNTAGAAVQTLSVGKSYSVRKTIAVDEEVEVGETGFKVKLAQVNAPAGSTSLPSCNLVITAADGRSVTKTRDRDSASVKISELGNIWLKVSAVGYSATAGASNTCEVSVYSDSLTLQNGTIDSSLYPNWRCMIDSANRSTTPGISDLRCYNDQYSFNGVSRAKVGDKMTIINGLTANTGYEIEFRGSDLTATEQDTLVVSEYDFSGIVPNSGHPGATVYYNAIMFDSTSSSAFRFASDNTDKIYFLAKNKTSVGNSPWNLTGGVVYQNSSGEWVYVNYSSSYSTYAISEPALGAIQVTYTLPAYYYASGGGADTSVQFTVAPYWPSLTSNFSVYANSGNNTVANNNFTALNISIREVLNDSTSTTAGAWHLLYSFDSASAYDGNFRSTIGGTTNDNLNYTSYTFGLAFNGNLPYCSPRGSCVESGAFTQSGVTVKYATRLGKGVYVIRKLLGTDTTTTAPTVDCTPGEACDLGSGYTVTIPTSLDLPTGEVETQQVVAINTAVRPLVVLDSDASSTQPLIVIGGPFVNSVAASMDQCAALADGAAGDALVAVEGNKLCVAGFTAADTKSAAAELIGFLVSWDPTAGVEEVVVEEAVTEE